MKYKDKLVLCKKPFENFKIGNFYKVDIESNYLNRTHVNIDGNWFIAEGEDFIWPNLYEHFFTDIEERSLKLQIINLVSRYK